MAFLPTARMMNSIFTTVTKFALPQKIFEPTVQKIKVEVPALFPRKNSDSSIFPHDPFLRLNPPYSPWILPSGWDDPHLTRKWAQEAGSGTCPIYMKSCNKVTQKRNKLTQRQSPFLCLCRRFFRLSILNLNVPALPFWQKNAARSQQKKELYAAAQLDLRQETVPGTEHFRTIFSAAHRALLGRLRHQYQFL